MSGRPVSIEVTEYRTAAGQPWWQVQALRGSIVVTLRCGFESRSSARRWLQSARAKRYIEALECEARER